MIMLDEEDGEQSVRNAIKESVRKKFPIIRANDFEFVKMRQNKVSVLELGPGTENGRAGTVVREKERRIQVRLWGKQ